MIELRTNEKVKAMKVIENYQELERIFPRFLNQFQKLIKNII